MTNYAKLSRDRRNKLKASGICIDCGKIPAENNRVKCNLCLEKSKKANKRYQKNNPEKVIARRKDWYSNGKFGHITRKSQKKQRLILRKKVIEKYGGKCSCCEELTYEFLQIDHVDKNGKEHRSKIGRGMKLHRDMLKETVQYRIRILCGNCHNAITAHGACPHEISKNTTPSMVEGSD